MPQLNPPQERAVEHLDGPLLVLAGAGSGKTRVITFRIARLIDRRVPAKHILAVTFTNKAANEMKERVAELVDRESAKAITVSTFHALGARILREDIGHLGYKTPFTILDQGDQIRIVKDVLKELKLTGTRTSEGRLLQIISKAKNAMTTPARLPEARYNPEMPRAQRVFDLYAEALRHLNAVDFDDLLLLTTRLLEEIPEVRDKYRRRYRYVMVDEYQDTNPIQMRLLRALVGPPSYNLVVVGDDDQSIYGFRGAVADNILRFAESFPGAETVALEQNYRSTSTILQAANAVIAHNAVRHPKTLWSDLGDGKPLVSVALPSNVVEAQFVANQLAKRGAAGRPWGDMAILYRTNPQARLLEESLRAYRVPYRILGGKSVFDKKEVRDVVAYLRLLVHPTDELAIRRIANYPSRGLGTKTLARVHALAERTHVPFIKALAHTETLGLKGRTKENVEALLNLLRRYRRALRGLPPEQLHGLLKRYVEEIGIEAAIRVSEKNAKIAQVRVSILNELVEGIQRVEGATAHERLSEYVGRLALDPGAGKDGDEDEDNVVTLMTLHSSKGLEFPVVYMVGMSEGLLPHKNALDERGGINEERRLCYVGMTRAKRELVLTRARFALIRNERIPLKPSRFLDEIPETLIREREVAAKSKEKVAEERANTQAQLEKMKAMLDAKAAKR